ncbi:MAG TPA: hypothetical protein VK968_12705 [Roseimicrobium sp.]|nr:hypothetical protein [Roseimicrobium sp.]
MPNNNPNRNITRHEFSGNKRTGSGAIAGWSVRFKRRGKLFQEFFGDSPHGGKRKALLAARKVRDTMENKFRPYTLAERLNRPTKQNTSGIRGVRIRETRRKVGGKWKVYRFAEAVWSVQAGKPVRVAFSVSRHGEKEAWKMALAARRKGVREAVNKRD